MKWGVRLIYLHKKKELEKFRKNNNGGRSFCETCSENADLPTATLQSSPVYGSQGAQRPLGA